MCYGCDSLYSKLISLWQKIHEHDSIQKKRNFEIDEIIIFSNEDEQNCTTNWDVI